MQLAAVDKNIDKGSTVFYVPLNNVRETIDRNRQRESVGFGIVQIALGIVCVVLNGVSVGILHYHGIGFTFLGVWSGALYIATGCLGIVAGNSKAKCQTVTYMLMCLMSSSLAVAVMWTGIPGATCSHQYCLSSSLEHVIEACILASAIIEGIIGILGAVLCFKAGICCGKKRTEPLCDVSSENLPFEDVCHGCESLQMKYALNGDHMMYFALNEQHTCAFDSEQRLPSDPPS